MNAWEYTCTDGSASAGVAGTRGVPSVSTVNEQVCMELLIKQNITESTSPMGLLLCFYVI